MSGAIQASLVVSLILAGAASAEVHDASFHGAGDQHSLQQWIDIQSSPTCIWRQFTDEAAIRASGMPFARVELRNGGVLEEGFTADAKPTERIRHKIVTYLPERLLVLRNISTGPGLPGGELYPRIVQVIVLEPRDGGVTRLTLAHTGYGEGPGYDKLYAFFRRGNAGYLTMVKKACEAPAAPSR
jgi:hypothetical protein